MKPSITLVDYSRPEGYKEAKTDFIVFVKNTRKSVLLFDPLLQVYKNNPQFRKMSMVAPAMKTPFATVYGWHLTDGVIAPCVTPSSREPYPIQVGSVTNSLIRRSALDKINVEFTGSGLTDSIILSLALWESGQRCYMAPDVIMDDTRGPNRAMEYPAPQVAIVKLFKREMIG